MTRQYGQKDDKESQPLIDQPTTEAPTAEEVTQFHKNADTDVRAEAIHHTLGIDSYQASPGNHRHDGSDSVLLLEGVVITGVTDAARINSIIQALVRLGATNNT